MNEDKPLVVTEEMVHKANLSCGFTELESEARITCSKLIEQRQKSGDYATPLGRELQETAVKMSNIIGSIKANREVFNELQRVNARESAEIVNGTQSSEECQENSGRCCRKARNRGETVSSESESSCCKNSKD